MKKQEIIIKVCFYLISLSPLFFLLMILRGSINENIKENTFAIFCFILLCCSGIGLLYLNDLRSNAKKLPIIVTKATNINYENLTFLSTYIIPLVAIPLDTFREKIVFVLLLIFIGVIFIRTNIFYSNPSLAILGYSVYKIDDSSGKYKESILIIRGNLKINDSVKCLKLSNNVYYGRKI